MQTFPDLERPPTQSELGLALRRARESRALRQADVARRANVRPLTLLQLEHGRTNATASVLFAVVVAVGLRAFLTHLYRVMDEATRGVLP
jgi:transcriptional regulator with XRE-family HTH domain